MTRLAFTLIELLVAVAIVAILASIAVANLLEAQTRSKVSRARADLAALRTALESYAVDEGSYPLNSGGLGLTGALRQLTEPTPYLSSLPKDVFLVNGSYLYLSGGKATDLGRDQFGAWILASVGPDGQSQTVLSRTTVYDPTNGSVSNGDVVLSQKE